MSEERKYTITVSEFKTYLYSLEHEKERAVAERVHEYKQRCNSNNTKVKKREIAKIEKTIEKEYTEILEIRDKILELLDEAKEIPIDIEKLEIAEYMLYRVDLRKAERVLNKVARKLGKRYQEIQEEVVDKIYDFPDLDDVKGIDYSEFSTDGKKLSKSKEQYKLEYTEEERNELITKELEIVRKVIEFNSIPIPHEILKNSDRDIQSKMQKFNSIRQKRIRILESMPEDYKKLIDPREVLLVIDEALNNIGIVKDILTKAEYKAVKNALIKRRKRVFRSTNDIRVVVETKEKKTGIANFNIQQARYNRMETLRNTILEAQNRIKENPITELEEQLEKLKISYEREKQFASVIEKLDDGRSGMPASLEVRAYEQQISSLGYRLANSRKIVSEAQEQIKNAKKELLILWKMEITSIVSKKKEMLELGAGRRSTMRMPAKREQVGKLELNKKAFAKLKKSSRGPRKACMHIKN
ncbi:MAG: hypothetical protein HFJ50_09345 [Clostridia bacterium]|nr:hypothetical protein [Clostridia bacterium]